MLVRCDVRCHCVLSLTLRERVENHDEKCAISRDGLEKDKFH